MGRLLDRYIRDLFINLNVNQHAFMAVVNYRILLYISKLLRFEEFLMLKSCLMCTLLDIERTFDSTYHGYLCKESRSRALKTLQCQLARLLMQKK